MFDVMFCIAVNCILKIFLIFILFSFENIKIYFEYIFHFKKSGAFPNSPHLRHATNTYCFARDGDGQATRGNHAQSCPRHAFVLLKLSLKRANALIYLCSISLSQFQYRNPTNRKLINEEEVWNEVKLDQC